MNAESLDVTPEMVISGAADDFISVSRAALVAAIGEVLLETFPALPCGEPSLSEWRATWIAD